MVETSWETSSRWYDDIVGDQGHYYHQEIILPGVIRLLNLKAGDHLLDVGCGQGVMARALPRGVKYTGVDASATLIKQAKQKSPKERFIIADATKPYSLEEKATHALCILSLQNMSDPAAALREIGKHVKGKILLILNHPCFRIPRQSSWGVDEAKKMQYRRVDRYMTPLEVPIHTHPGTGKETTTYSFHFPFSYWFTSCHQAGFSILEAEEWCSNKESTGGRAKMENRARKEFPLFLALFGQSLSN
jgi:SAM-dependent methyltransferase